MGVLSDAFTRAQIPVGSLWGNVPHYISASPNPKVVAALLSRLSEIYGLGLELSEMERAGRRFERQVNAALMQNPEVAQYVKQLEAREETAGDADDDDDSEEERHTGTAADLPRGEDVVRQLEEFLRQRQTQSDDDDNDEPDESAR